MTYNDMLIQYVYHPHYSDVRIGCLVALIHTDDSKIHIGWSQCSPLDHFNKRRGREIATDRALVGTKVKPTPYRFYNPDGSYERKDILTAEMDLFKFRALKYFTPELADDKLVKDCELTFLLVPEYRAKDLENEENKTHTRSVCLGR